MNSPPCKSLQRLMHKVNSKTTDLQETKTGAATDKAAKRIWGPLIHYQYQRKVESMGGLVIYNYQGGVEFMGGMIV